MDPTRSRSDRGAELPFVRAACFWMLLGATLAVPLLTHQLEFGASSERGGVGQATAPPESCNRAAVCVAEWIRNGKLTGINGHAQALCLRVSSDEWAKLSPCEREEVWRDLALLGQVSRSDRPVFVRDEDDRVLLAGMCRDAN